MLSPKPWEPERVLRLLFYLFLCLALGSGLVQLAGIQPESGAGENWILLVVGTIAFHTITLVLVHLFLRAHDSTWRNAFGLDFQFPRAIKIGCLGAVIIVPIALMLNALSVAIFQSFQAEVTVQPAVKALETAITWEQKLAFGFMAIIAAPIVEEVFFRGIIYPALKQRGLRHMALWGSAIFFAIIHAHAITLGPLIFLGIALALIYEATDNLVAPICAHALFNGLNFAYLISN